MTFLDYFILFILVVIAWSVFLNTQYVKNEFDLIHFHAVIQYELNNVRWKVLVRTFSLSDFTSSYLDMTKKTIASF